MIKKGLLFVFLILVGLGCNRKIEDLNTRKIQDYFNQLPEPNLNGIQSLLIVPIDKGYGFCVSKVVEFSRVFDIPSTMRIVLTSADGTLLNNFVVENSLQEKKGILLDDKNYFFLNELIFLKPTFYHKSDEKWIPTELVPINVEEILFDNLLNSKSNPHLIEFYELNVSGEIKKVETRGNQVMLELKSNMGFGIDSILRTNKAVFEAFGPGFGQGTLLMKEPRSFYYLEYILENSMSAKVTRKTPKFKNQ
jgi:hypothetical protein